MNNRQVSDDEKELYQRLLTHGMSDEEFLGTFFERWGRDIKSDLEGLKARNPAGYEEMLESWIETAENDYRHWFMRSARVQEGDIPPKKTAKKKRRARKLKDVAGMWERQEALARYLEGVASEEREIVRFRKRAMSGRLLSEEEALAFLSSPLLADQPLSALVGNDISLLEQSHWLEEETDENDPYRELVIEGWRPWRVRPLAAKGPELVYPGDVLRLQDVRRLRGVDAIFFPHPREEDRLVIARGGSVIAELFRLAEDRLVGYPISAELGVWFILTGEFIPQDPVRMRYMMYRHPEFSRTALTLEVEGWVPPEEVLEQYRYVQSQVLGKTPRSPHRKALNVFKFVNGHKEKSWGELFELWNKQHPNERFKDRSHLYTTYTRAFEYIVSPIGLLGR